VALWREVFQDAADPGRMVESFLVEHLRQHERVTEVDGQQFGAMEQTHYRWRRECVGLQTYQARCLQELERENARLKCLQAGAERDKAILEEAASGRYRARRRGARRSSTSAQIAA
jgi:putative transposase